MKQLYIVERAQQLLSSFGQVSKRTDMPIAMQTQQIIKLEYIAMWNN